MSQTDIFQYMKLNKGVKFTVADIQKVLCIGQPNIHRALKQMRRFGEVEFESIQTRNKKLKYVYWYGGE